MSHLLDLPQETSFTEVELALIKNQPIPRHVAIIMDGNRRWAKGQNFLKNPMGGHWAGAKVLLDIVQAAYEVGIAVLTVYAFSTENWRRSPSEIQTLMKILEVYLKENRQKMIEKGVRFDVIGDLAALPDSIREEVMLTREMTKKGSRIDLVLALNYGARDELRRAMLAIAEDYKEQKISKEEIDENLIASYLDTARFGDPELLIRTSGEMRVSNFLLWQVAYTELYITEVFWPDFSAQHFYRAIAEFQKRERRRGR